MDTAVLEKSVHEEQWLGLKPEMRVVTSKKKSFEEACAECNAVSVDVFFDELRKRVKERYQNAKGQDIR